MEKRYILEMRNITKEFPGVRALDNVTFRVAAGEIHGLVGENGAGKSTLMKILSGVYPYGEYTGEIIFNGELVQFRSIRDSERAGIGIIYQELALVPELPVYENIFIGHEITNGFTIDWNETIRRANEMLEKVGLRINPTVKVKDLGVGQQQLVEIAKALSKEVKLLILDEPTSALSEEDVAVLFDLLRALKAQGVTCVLISHKLREVIEIADTVTVLRDGKTICTLDAHKGEVTREALVKNMVGREINDVFPKREHRPSDEVVFEVRNWNVYDRMLRKYVLRDVHFKVRRGEIVGLAGLMGSGRTELALSLFGNPREYHVEGEVYVKGKRVEFKHPEDAIAAGVAYVTEDRKGNGLILIQDVKQNITLSNLEEVSRWNVVDAHEEIRVAEHYRQALDIKTPSLEQKVLNLSGGNQQKVSLAKWLFARPEILILDEPTRGIDVGAKYEIYTIMNELVQQGMSILLISSELPEILGMSDRIYVLSSGRITGELPADRATQEEIMYLATLH